MTEYSYNNICTMPLLVYGEVHVAQAIDIYNNLSVNYFYCSVLH